MIYISTLSSFKLIKSEAKKKTNNLKQINGKQIVTFDLVEMAALVNSLNYELHYTEMHQQ